MFTPSPPGRPCPTPRSLNAGGPQPDADDLGRHTVDVTGARLHLGEAVAAVQPPHGVVRGQHLALQCADSQLVECVTDRLALDVDPCRHQLSTRGEPRVVEVVTPPGTAACTVDVEEGDDAGRYVTPLVDQHLPFGVLLRGGPPACVLFRGDLVLRQADC